MCRTLLKKTRERESEREKGEVDYVLRVFRVSSSQQQQQTSGVSLFRILIMSERVRQICLVRIKIPPFSTDNILVSFIYTYVYYIYIYPLSYGIIRYFQTREWDWYGRWSRIIYICRTVRNSRSINSVVYYILHTRTHTHDKRSSIDDFTYCWPRCARYIRRISIVVIFTLYLLADGW